MCSVLYSDIPKNISFKKYAGLSENWYNLCINLNCGFPVLGPDRKNSKFFHLEAQYLNVYASID